MTALTEHSIHQYAQALVDVHGRQAPYMAAIHALARRESSEPEGWHLWLAVGEVSATIICGQTTTPVH